MTREDIIWMARESGIKGEISLGQFVRLCRFSKLVAAHEREVWAKYLDDCGEHEHANFVRSRGEVQP